MLEFDDEKTDPDLRVLYSILECEGERRAACRLEIELAVTLASDAGVSTGVVENLSQGGVFVATPTLLPIGTVLELCVAVPELDQCIVGSGEVCWQRSEDEANDGRSGIGIRFVYLGTKSSNIIEALFVRRDS